MGYLYLTFMAVARFSSSGVAISYVPPGFMNDVILHIMAIIRLRYVEYLYSK